MKKVISLVTALVLTLSVGTCSQGIRVKAADVDIDCNYTDTVTQDTPYGTVQGLNDQNTNTLQWLGVPYAKPPVGDLRWKAPQNPDKWTGVLKTQKYGNMSVQLSGNKVVGSEDCLYLNIWRPNTKSTNLPVLVFAHGGGNITGSGQAFQGDVLASKTNSIVISINYRLGAMGWFTNNKLKTWNKLDDSGNYGLLDIFKALEWVKSNISSFGGNSSNVTLSGQSAGARDVMASLISPLANGLFDKAMPMSGGMTLDTTDNGSKFSDQIVKKLAIKDGLAKDDASAQKWLDSESSRQLAAYLKSKDAKDIVALYGSVAIKMNQFPHLYKDGYVIPKQGFNVIKTDNYNKVPIMVGSMDNEFTAFDATDPYFGSSVLDQSIFKDPNKLKIYTDSMKYGSELYSGFNADNVSDLLVTNDDQPGVYAYRCAWGTQDGVINNNTKVFAAAHGIDVDLFTDHFTFAISSMYPNMFYTDQNKPGREDLSNVMSSYLKNFLYTGNPNGDNLNKWGTWLTGNYDDRIMKFDASPTTASAQMSSEHLVKQNIINDMELNLPQDEINIIINKLFNGRFFWDY